MSRRRRSVTDIDGVLVVDKPAGPTSHDVVQRIRRAAGQARVGHTGTLDPEATGVLVVCLGRATRLVRFLQAGRKTYAARMVLGVETTTQDGAGEVVAVHDARDIDERRLCEVLTRFQGEIEQIPPMVSAVKVGGERLHAKARRGEEIEREPRRATIDDLVLDAFEPGPQAQASFLVTCSPGTYVRTLAHDVGRVLGVGGSLTALRRIANGAFAVEDAHDLAAIEAAGAEGRLSGLLLSPADAVRRALPVLAVDDPAEALAVTRGGRRPAQQLSGPYALLYGDLLLAIHADRGAEARPELVWTRPEELAAVGGAPAVEDAAPSTPAPGEGAGLELSRDPQSGADV